MNRWIEAFELKGAQAQAVVTRDRDVTVAAGAGSGKTRTLVARYISLLDEGCPPRGVIAITFTEKAAREMRNRIRAAIHAWRTGNCPPEDRPRWETIEADVDAARIGTIHGLCAAILRAHPAEAGVDPQFEVLDEGLSAALKAQAVDDALAWAIDQSVLAPLFTAFSAGELESILSKLLAYQLESRAALDMPDTSRRWETALRNALARFAGQETVLAAASELRQLIDSGQLDTDAGDKLAPKAIEAMAHWTTAEQSVADSETAAAARALFHFRRACAVGGAGKKTSRAKAAIGELRQAYDETINLWLGGSKSDDPAPNPESDARAAESVMFLGRLFDRALGIYQGAKDLRQALDFDDLESLALQLLSDREIRARWQRQIAALLVDEFQDTNDRQRRIVEALAGVAEGRAGRLFVVGDAKQSIYRFRGADVTVFRRLGEDIRDRGGVPLELDLTFRAHAPLVGAVNELLKRVMGEADDPGRPFRVPFAPMTAHRDNPRAGIEPPYVELLCGLGENAEVARPAGARLLARRLRELRDRAGVSWEDIALLFRAAPGFPAYEDALEAEAIPFVTVAGRGFYDRPEVRDLLNILRALADPWDDLAMAGLLRSPAFGLSDSALYQLRWPDSAQAPLSFRAALVGNLSRLAEEDRKCAERAREIVEQLAGLVDRVPVAELLKQTLDRTMYPAILASTPKGARSGRNVDKLLADAHASGLVRVMEFLEYLETLRAAGAREGEAPTESEGAVRLMTVHKAKGLEFPVTVIADAARTRPNVSDSVLLSPQLGLAPCPGRLEQPPIIFRLAKTLEREQSDAEDLRLLYVAATRAKEKLILCGHYTRRAAGGWLGQVAAAAGLDLVTLGETPGEWSAIQLPESKQFVGVLADVAGVRAEGLEAPEATPASQPAPTGQAALFRPYGPSPVAAFLDEASADRASLRVRRVTGRRRRADGTAVGVLVHAALRRWKFPGDPALGRLLESTALDMGIVEPSARRAATAEAETLLARLRADPRWAEINVAQRRHEVPYSLPVDDKTVGGFIDLLYQADGGQWKIVDFKTDAIASEEEMERLIEGSYGEQMRRYREAVKQLLRQTAEAELCFLDYAGQVRWVAVAQDKSFAIRQVFR